MTGPSAKLSLRPLTRTDTGETVEPLRLVDQTSVTIGRSSEADWPIPDPSISRRHARLTLKGEAWFISDLQSRHGTTLNGKRLEPGQPALVAHGDEIGFGVWRCLCQAGDARAGVTTPFVQGLGAEARISAVDASRLSGVAQRGLDALLSLTGDLDNARSIEEVAAAAAAAVSSATGCPRVVVVRVASENDIEVLGSTIDESPQLSQSLIHAAARQGLVELMVTGQDQDYGQSIMDLKIRSAICAPILAGGSPVAYLTLDTRDMERTLPPDAAAFCQSVTRLAGLSIERIGAAKLAERHRQLREDLDAARRAQELLSPPTRGRHAAVSYTFECIPGRVVAGDLFDFFPLDESRAAFFLGDVSGKGVGAAMLMASAQSQLRTQLLSGNALESAVAQVSADLHRRTESSKFVTLFAGVIDGTRGVVRIVDAGHGFGILIPAHAEPRKLEAPNGFPLGVLDSTEYAGHEAPFESGASLVLFSDGAIEQPDPEGRQFGLDAVLRSVARAPEPQDIVDALVRDVRAHAQADLADDLTVAVVQLDPQI